MIAVSPAGSEGEGSKVDQVYGKINFSMVCSGFKYNNVHVVLSWCLFSGVARGVHVVHLHLCTHPMYV